MLVVVYIVYFELFFVYAEKESMASESKEKLTKFVDQIGELSVLELNSLVKELEDKFGVSASMPMAAAAPATAAAPAEAEKSEYKVTLTEVDSASKIKAIKALKAATGKTLTDIKAMIENIPSIVAESMPKEDAEKIKKELAEVGSKVTLS